MNNRENPPRSQAQQEQQRSEKLMKNWNFLGLERAKQTRKAKYTAPNKATLNGESYTIRTIFLYFRRRLRWLNASSEVYLEEVDNLHSVGSVEVLKFLATLLEKSRREKYVNGVFEVPSGLLWKKKLDWLLIWRAQWIATTLKFTNETGDELEISNRQRMNQNELWKIESYLCWTNILSLRHQRATVLVTREEAGKKQKPPA